MRRFLPRMGWCPISASDAAELGLAVRQPWEVFNIEWRGRGIALAVRPRRED